MRSFFTSLCYRVMLVATALLIPGRMQAQEPPVEKIKYAGRDFWMSLYQPEVGNTNEFYISGRANANITFTYTNTGIMQNYNLQAGTVLRIKLSNAELNLMANNQIEIAGNKSLHIHADTDVVIQFISWGTDVDDGMTLYPSDRQQFGSLYYLNGPSTANDGIGISVMGAFTVVATCDNVVLEITPVRKTATHAAAIPFTVTLNKGGTYTMANRWTNDIKDLSGTKVRVVSAGCCNPINIFNTHMADYLQWPYVLPYSCCADQQLEQLLPVSVWDTLHQIVPYINCAYTIIKIVSGAGNNVLSMDGNVFATLAEGGTLDTIITEPVIIRSTGPVGITQYMISQGENEGINLGVDSLSDPNASWVMPIRDGVKESIFKTAGNSYYEALLDSNFTYHLLHVLTLVSRTENVNTITLNDISVAGQFLPFPGDNNYMYANIRPDTGVTYRLHSGERIGAYYYAAQDAGTIDFHLGDINPSYFFEKTTADTTTACVGETTHLATSPALSYTWSTGATAAAIDVTDTGTYSVLKYYDDDCIGELETYTILPKLPTVNPFNLGLDTVVCLGSKVVLSAGEPATGWSDGSVGPELVVREPGAYWAYVSDSCARITHSDTIRIEYRECPELFCRIMFPNAFSPNGDGKNDVFKPNWYGALSNYILNVYNRWGQRVFSSAKIDEGWDGMYRNVPAALDVYYYQCIYFCPQKGLTQLKGEVTLVR